MQNPIFTKINELRIKIEHAERQRGSTFNLDERDKFTGQIDLIKREIDVLLDEYNFREKFEKNIVQ